MSKRDFLEMVENFLKKTNMSPTAFGVLANKEPNLVFLMRNGRECREETRERILNFINSYGDK